MYFYSIIIICRTGMPQSAAGPEAGPFAGPEHHPAAQGTGRATPGHLPLFLFLEYNGLYAGAGGLRRLLESSGSPHVLPHARVRSHQKIYLWRIMPILGRCVVQVSKSWFPTDRSNLRLSGIATGHRLVATLHRHYRPQIQEGL